MEGVPTKDLFSEDSIQAFVIGKQNCSTGAKMMAAGDVSGVRLHEGRFVGFVHAEKTGNLNYETKVAFGPGGEIVASECACAARNNAHNRCKHVSALLHFLLAARSYPLNADKPKWGKRPGIKIMYQHLSAEQQAAVRYNMTWEDCIARGLAPTGRHLGTYAPKKRTLAQAVASVAKKRDKRLLGYCLCDGPEDGHMIACDYCKGKGRWYHVPCLEKIDIFLPFDDDGKLPRGQKFKCPRCEMQEKMRR